MTMSVQATKRYSFRGTGLVCAATLIIAACAGDRGADKAARLTMPSQSVASRIAAARSRQTHTVTVEEFLAKNPMAWAGRTHTRGLQVLFSEIARDPKQNGCVLFTNIIVGTKLLGADSLRGALEDRRKALSEYFSRSGHCKSYVAAAASVAPASPRLFRNASRSMRRDDVYAYMYALDSAVDQTSDPDTYASLVDGISTAANADLTGDDLDGFNTAASIAVSSFAYWTYNAQAVIDSGVAAEAAGGGGCDGADSPSDCGVRMTAGPGVHRDARARMTFRNVAFSPPVPCDPHADSGELIHADVLGAVAGFGGGLLGLASMGTAIIGGALGSSMGEAVWQIGTMLFCAK